MMNREEAKELLPIIQAYAEGKEIQLKNNGVWLDAKYFIPFDQITPDEIRIKPESKYRPFKDAEECWNEMLKHQPFGWTKDENNKYYHIASGFNANKEGYNIVIETVGYKSFNGVLACYTFADGTPFGIEEGSEE